MRVAAAGEAKDIGALAVEQNAKFDVALARQAAVRVAAAGEGAETATAAAGERDLSRQPQLELEEEAAAQDSIRRHDARVQENARVQEDAGSGTTWDFEEMARTEEKKEGDAEAAVAEYTRSRAEAWVTATSSIETKPIELSDDVFIDRLYDSSRKQYRHPDGRMMTESAFNASARKSALKLWHDNVDSFVASGGGFHGGEGYCWDDFCSCPRSKLEVPSEDAPLPPGSTGTSSIETKPIELSDDVFIDRLYDSSRKQYRHPDGRMMTESAFNASARKSALKLWHDNVDSFVASGGGFHGGEGYCWDDFCSCPRSKLEVPSEDAPLPPGSTGTASEAPTLGPDDHDRSVSSEAPTLGFDDDTGQPTLGPDDHARSVSSGFDDDELTVDDEYASDLRKAKANSLQLAIPPPPPQVSGEYIDLITPPRDAVTSARCLPRPDQTRSWPPKNVKKQLQSEKSE